MNRYDKYQASVLPWVEKIPAHWEWMRNGRLFIQHLNKVGKEYSQHQLLSLTTEGIKEKDITDVKGKVPASYSNYQTVNSGDMVFCLFDLDQSAVFSGISQYDGMITSAYDVATPNSELVNATYIDYWFRAVFAGRHYKTFAKSIRYTINFDVFKAIKSPVPPMAEQDQIVRYLDWKTSEIHRLINGLQQQILLLKQRNQVIIDHAVTKGIRKNRELRADKAEWMGSVPSEWLSCRMKNFFIETNVRSVDGHEPHLSMSQKKGLVTDDEDIERRLLSESYVGGKVCQKDDLVLNRLKAHLGVFALAPMEGVISPDYTVLHLNQDRIIPKYAEYLLRSNACRKELRTRVRGIVEGFWRLYTEDLGSIPVCLPDIDEQKEILDYVKAYEEKSNQMIGKLEKEIELLREYRTRLISDVVTGQMDVRNVEIPDYIPEQDEVIDAVDETDVGEVDADAE